MNYIEEEITLAEFADRFLNLIDFNTPVILDITNLNIEALSKNLVTGNDEYKKIKSFLIKPGVESYYTDGKMQVADIEVDENENYYANGRLNHNTTSGGKAVGFHSSVRLRMSNSGALKKKDWGGVDQIIGNKVEVKVTKNRLGPPQRKASFEMFYDSGIDNYSGWLKVLATYKLIKQSGAYYTYDIIDSETGEVTEQIKFMAKDLVAEFEKNKLLKENMYKDLCKIMIMEYKKNGDVIAFDNSDIEEDDTEEIPED
jgi:hypothetical protein